MFWSGWATLLNLATNCFDHRWRLATVTVARSLRVIIWVISRWWPSTPGWHDAQGLLLTSVLQKLSHCDYCLWQFYASCTQRHLQQHPTETSGGDKHRAASFSTRWIMSIVAKQLRISKTAAWPVLLLIMNVIPEACEGIRLLSRCNFSESAMTECVV